jgi:hypothetical protein
MPARGILRTLALVGCTAAFAGCSSDSTFPAELAGDYQLATVNGSPLPFTLPGTAAGTTAKLNSGSLIILDNGRFDEQLHYFLTTSDNPTGGNTQSETLGDVSASGGNVTFSPRFEDSYSGTYTATSITYSKQVNATVTLTFVFNRAN